MLPTIDLGFLPGLSNIAQGLSYAAGELRSLRPVMEDIRDDVLIERIRNNFAKETAAGYYDWADLRERTQLERERLGFGRAHPILVRTGKLKRVATQKNIWEFHGNGEVMAVTGLPGAEYGEELQKGRDEDNMPPREFIIFNNKDQDKMERIFTMWIGQRIGMSIAGGVAVRSLLPKSMR